MAMNLSALNNISPFTVNTSLINESTEIVPNLVSNANQTTDGYFGLGIMLIMFLFLLIITMADQEVFRLTFTSALLFSSSIALLAGVVMMISNVISNFQHVMFFALVFLAALLMKYYEKT